MWEKTYFGNLSELQDAKMAPTFFERLQATLSYEPENVSEQVRVSLTAFMSSELCNHAANLLVKTNVK
jgi:hypothetical protein